MLQLSITANSVSSSLILSTLIMEMIQSPKTSVPTRSTQRNIPEDGILLLLVFMVASSAVGRVLLSSSGV
jgi:ABC-type enterochelin transport system permease subunit